MGSAGIPPYRMAQLVKISSKIADTMLSGVWQLNYEEIGIVMEILRTAVESSKKVNDQQAKGG